MSLSEIMDSADDLFIPRQRLKRTHRQMEAGASSSSFISSGDPEWPRSSYSLSTSRSRSPSQVLFGTPQPMDYRVRRNPPTQASAPDSPHRQRGFDYRRPIMTATPPPQSHRTIIDLTEDGTPSDNDFARQSAPSGNVSGQGAHRLPRYEREIIDLSDDTPPGNNSGPPNAPHATHSSPDVEFVSSRRLHNPLPPRARTPQLHAPPPPRHLHLPELEPDVLFVGQQPVERRTRQEQAIRDYVRERVGHYLGHQILRPGGVVENVGVPVGVFGRLGGGGGGINLNFEAVGFDLGLAREESMAPVNIQPPDLAPEGFTRTPLEDEVLLCPNCNDELGVGETDQKKQIWVSKRCGHVYCGDCNHARALTANKKGKSKAPLVPTKCPPFKKCVVENCGVQVNGKNNMLQLYL